MQTLNQLDESAKRVCLVAGSGDVELLAAEIDSVLRRFRQKAKAARPIKPLTPMIDEIARDLHKAVQEDGITAAPDSSGLEAEILVPVHQPYDMDILGENCAEMREDPEHKGLALPQLAWPRA